MREFIDFDLLALWCSMEEDKKKEKKPIERKKMQSKLLKR
jgi:hypothetical protein